MKDRRLHHNGPPAMIQSVAKNLLNGYRLFIAVLILSVLFVGSLISGQLVQPALANDAPHVALELTTSTATTVAPVEVTASGIWMSGCTPRYSTHSIDEYKVRIFAVAEDDGPCPQYLESWSFPVMLPLVSVGTYDVDIYAISEGMPGYQLQDSMRIDVSDGTVQDSQISELVAYAPANPEVDDDIIVTVEGVNSDGCVPAYVSHEMVTGTTVMIDAAEPVDMVCGQVITPWSFDTNIGKLGAGVYTLEVYVTSDLGARELYQTRTMNVGAIAGKRLLMDSEFYLPAVVFQ